MPEKEHVEDEFDIHDQYMDLNENRDDDLACDNCGLKFSVHDNDEGDTCPECFNGELSVL